MICWRFYELKLIKELGLDRDARNETSNTYKTCNHIQKDLLIAKHSKKLSNKFHLSGKNYKKRLPFIYWLLKLHNNPNKGRFTTAAPVSSIKSLSKLLAIVFKLFF